MSTVFDKFERFGKDTYNAQDVLKNHFLTIYPIHYTNNTIDESVAEQYATQADYVWIVDDSISVIDSFPWHYRPDSNEEPKRHAFPYVFKGSKRIRSWSVVKLVPTKVIPTETVQHKHIAAYYDVYCGKDKFDIFHGVDFETAQKQSTTDMFWLVPDDVVVSEFFKFTFRPDDWSHKFVHVFGNGSTDSYDGIALFPKHYAPVHKEIEHRFYANKKEVSIRASDPRVYPTFTFETFEEYTEALKTTSADLFWHVPNDVEIEKELTLYFNHHNQYDRRINHVFLNGKEYDGVVLFSKHSPVTEKEFKHRFYANKKEHPERYSRPKKFDKFIVNNYADYKLAKQRSKTEMFWAVPDDVEVAEDFNFDIYFTHHNTYDRNLTHVFANGRSCDGIVLHSTNINVTEREVDYRFYADKKEWNIVASHPKIFPVYDIDTYEQYKHALEHSPSELFWMGSANISMLSPIYNVYISHHDRNLRKQNHVFLHQQNNNVSYNGMILCSKHKPLTKKEVEYRHPVERIEHSDVISKNKLYDEFDVETYEDYLEAFHASDTEMFWVSSPNIDTSNFDFTFTFDFDNHYDRKINHAFQHNVDGEIFYNGLFLCSKHSILTQNEVLWRHIVGVKEWDIEASCSKEYDKYVIETYEDYLMAMENSETELFYGYSENIDVRDFDFDIYFVHSNQYDRHINHNFIHLVDGKHHRNGVFLYSKHKPVTAKEIEYRHVVDAKEWNVIASKPAQYERFVVNNYSDYLRALDTVRTEMFWLIPSDVEVAIDFEFNYYFTHDNEYDRKTNHVFKNGEYWDGIVLASTHSIATEKEIENKFFVDKKDYEITASYPKQYDKFIVETYNDYLNAIENSQTDMFWASTNNIKLDDDFDLSLYFPHYNAYDRNTNHAFIHKVADENLYNGLFLLSKHKTLTQKEIEYRTIADRKEWNIVASGPSLYDKFNVNSYKDYLYAVDNSKTELFWIIPNKIQIDLDFNFDMYFDHSKEFERKTNHVFKNGEYWDGISLVSKHTNITEKEIQLRFLANKKEYNVVASTPLLYDIVFISYNESNADSNYAKLCKKYPNAKRVHGVKGIHQAHIEAAKLCKTNMFFVVDGDADILDNFTFDYYVPQYDITSKETVHVWKSQNPINGLIYGYGGVKLLPRELTLNMDTNTADMTTSISKYFKAINRVSNITAFNTDEFSTWRSAFRECVKLSSRTIKGQLDEETEFRLNAWCTRGKDKLFGNASINGANHGKEYGDYAANNADLLKKINDFKWLEDEFKRVYQKN